MAKSLGEQGDAIYRKAAEITAANAKVKKLEDERNAMEAELIESMEKAGTTSCKGKIAKIEIKPKIRYGVEDFETLAAFVYRRKALHLMQRRFSDPAVREMKETLGGKAIPGMSEFEQKTLSVTKA